MSSAGMRCVAASVAERPNAAFVNCICTFILECEPQSWPIPVQALRSGGNHLILGTVSKLKSCSTGSSRCLCEKKMADVGACVRILWMLPPMCKCLRCTQTSRILDAELRTSEAKFQRDALCACVRLPVITKAAQGCERQSGFEASSLSKQATFMRKERLNKTRMQGFSLRRASLLYLFKKKMQIPHFFHHCASRVL